MKALIRNNNEIITEDNGLPGIEWETGMPLTNPYWAGGPYTLVENYIPPDEEEEESVTTEANAKQIAEIAELKARLAALESDL